MSVTIKQTCHGSSVYLLSLEYNPPVVSVKSGNPVYEEPLKLSVYRNPTTPRMKLFNHDNYERAESIRRYREGQILRKEIRLFASESEKDLLGLYRTMAQRTDVNYKASFLWFSDFTHGSCPYEKVDVGLAMDYRQHLLGATEAVAEKTLMPKTAAQYFNQFRYVLREAYHQGFLKEDLHDCIDPIKTETEPGGFVTMDEIRALMRTECRREQIPRMCWFIALTGVRTSFLMRLKWEDVIVVPGQRPFIVTKVQRSQRDDIMYITEEALEYLGRRKKTGPVFEKSSRLLKELHRWERDAGVRDNLSFEDFRLRLATLKVRMLPKKR